MTQDILEITARTAHEVNRAYCAAIGDHSQKPWDSCPEWQRDSARKGVEFHVRNPGAGPEASHDSWLAEKRRDGWRYGPFKDVEAKTHPCFVAFSELPLEQQIKDHLFRAVVHGILG